MINNIQTLSIQKGLNGLASGNFKGILLIHCIADGNVTVHFPTGDETVSLTAGSDRSISNVDITINSGTFDLNR